MARQACREAESLGLGDEGESDGESAGGMTRVWVDEALLRGGQSDVTPG